ncbi:MAG: DUF4160 domain-containing protein [Vulcanimicrobiota bacterium]
MPIISEFNGIKIVIRSLEDVRHNPHFHAISGEYAVSFDIVTKEITGEMPANKMMDIIVWANKYRSQIKKNWFRVKYGKPVIMIPGL